MDRGIRQAAKSFQQLLTLQRRGFSQGFTLNHFGKAGTSSNGSNASAGSVTYLVDPAVDQLHRQIHDVAAYRVLKADLSVWRRKLAYITRMLEMIEDLS